MKGVYVNEATLACVLLVVFFFEQCTADGEHRLKANIKQYNVSNQHLHGSRLVVFGNGNYVKGNYAYVAGNRNRIKGNDAFVRGDKVRVRGGGNVKIYGNNAFVRGPNSTIVFGDNADIVSHHVRVEGDNAKVHATASVRLFGENAQVESDFVFIIGANSRVIGNNAFILGGNHSVRGEKNFIIGDNAYVEGDLAHVAGDNVFLKGDLGKVEGKNPRVSGSGTLVCSDIGRNVSVHGHNIEIRVLFKYFDGKTRRHEKDPTFYDNRVVIIGENNSVMSQSPHCKHNHPDGSDYDYHLEISGDEIKVEVDGEVMTGGKKNGNEIVVMANDVNDI